MEGKDSEQYEKKRKNGGIPWECEEPSSILLRQFEVKNGQIRRNAKAVEAMMMDHHPNGRRRIAFNLRRLARRVEREQNSLVGKKRACSMVGILGGAASFFGGGMFITESDGITAAMIAVMGIIIIFIGRALSFWSSVSNTKQKSGLVEEIDAQIKQERKFYTQLYDKLEELDELLVEYENECHNVAETMVKWSILTLTTSAAILPVNKLLDYVDIEQLRSLTPKLMIPAVLYDLSPDDEKRKVAGGLVILAGVATLGINVYNLVDGYKNCARNGEAEKIRELADILVKFDEACLMRDSSK